MDLLTAIQQYKQDQVFIKIRNKFANESVSNIDEAECWEALADLLILLLPDGIISGLEVTVVDANLIVSPGVWKVDGVVFTTIANTTLPYDPQDPDLSRFDVVTANGDGTIGLISGDLSNPPIEPNVPAGSLKVASVFITPTQIIVNPPPTGTYVDTLTDQFVDGYKTFIKSPQVPEATGPNDAVNLSQVQDLVFFDEIIDDEPDWFNGLLNFINAGSVNITAEDPDQGAIVLAPTDTYPFNFDEENPADVPVIDFNTAYLYSLEPDDIDDEDSTFLTSVAAAAKVALFTKGFADDYVASNGNGNVNMKAVNLVISTDAAEWSQLTQVQVIDQVGTVSRYNAIPSTDIITQTNLVDGHTHKILIEGADPSMVIAITAGNKSGVLYKTKELLTGDPDNSFTAPITISLIPAVS